MFSSGHHGRCIDGLSEAWRAQLLPTGTKAVVDVWLSRRRPLIASGREPGRGGGEGEGEQPAQGTNEYIDRQIDLPVLKCGIVET